ncbi:MAG: hypothetical protein PHQ85_09170 [Eubacteriales bacterium]|jgi:hypothetical protein|nr:hypothetical protein [Eubacteriales bacterium]MDD4106071.1 hypothetical protein [Eubacteriales bacterium]MDD4711312.1 hypothetical protein [Eubacteriales bacterium]NLO15612.1 hypothetical protein [Clostridiales bacterium]
MRRLVRGQVPVRAVKVRMLVSRTGALSQVESPETEQSFRAQVRPIDQRAWRDPVSLRTLERRLVLPQGFPDIAQGDHLYMGTDARCFRCTEARSYPLHMEIEVEAMP